MYLSRGVWDQVYEMASSVSVTSCQFSSVGRGWEGAELCTRWKLHRMAVVASRAEQRPFLFI